MAEITPYQYAQYVKSQIFFKYPQLFKKPEKRFVNDEYFSFFYKINKLYPSQIPIQYNIEVIEQFLERVVYTGYIEAAGQTHRLYSLFQISPDYHIVVYYSFNDKTMKHTASIIVYVNDNTKMIEFIKNNEVFECKDEQPQKNFGFAGFKA